MGVDEIVLGIIGIGTSASLGFNIATKVSGLDFIKKVYLNEKDRVEKLQTFIDTSIDKPVRSKYMPADIETLATECDVILFCFGKGPGASKGNITSAPPDIRRRLFNANIDPIMDYAGDFGRLKSDATMLICTNPTDQLAYFFNIAYNKARGSTLLPGKVLGMNHVDMMRIHRLVSDHLKGLEIDPDYLEVGIYGPHDKRMFLAPSQCTYDKEGERISISDDISFSDINRIIARAGDVPFKILETLHATSDNTARAVVEVLRAMNNGEDVCALSHPVPGEYIIGEHDIFMGLPVVFDDRCRAMVLDDRISALHKCEKTKFDATIIDCQKESGYLHSRKGSISNRLPREKNPKFFKELVVPMKKVVDGSGENWLHFLNFTYPFKDFSEVRDPIKLHGRVGYVNNLIKGGVSLLGLCYVLSNDGVSIDETGVEVIDPVSGKSEVHSSETIGANLNGCCYLDDVIIASSSNAGLFISEEGILNHLSGVGKTDFKGYVREHNGKLYFAMKDKVVCAKVDSNSINIRTIEEFPLDSDEEILNFALFDEKMRTRVFVTTREGRVYDLSDKAGGGVWYEGSVLSMNSQSDMYCISVDYILDDHNLVVSKDDAVLIIGTDVPKGEFRTMLAGRGAVYSVLSDMLGGIVSLTYSGEFLNSINISRESRKSEPLAVVQIGQSESSINDIGLYEEWADKVRK